VQASRESSTVDSVQLSTEAYSIDSTSTFAADSMASELSTEVTMLQPDKQITEENTLAEAESVKEKMEPHSERVLRSIKTKKQKAFRSIGPLPRRIQCRAESRVIKGESGTIVYLSLLDSAEKETVAHKNFWISVEIYYLTKKENYRDSVFFERGELIVPYKLSVQHEGPFKVVFNNKELNGCELMLKSIDQKKETGWLPGSAPTFRFASFQQVSSPLVLVIPPTSIFYKANGRQEAPITYSLEDPANLWPETEIARINVVAPEGLLSSTSVIVDRASLGLVSLKSTQAGIIKVRSFAVTPGIRIDPSEVSIKFVKDIDSFEILMPDSLHLLEEGELVINLKNTAGNNITTDQDIPYSLAIEGSALRLEPKNGIIEKGKASARLKVIPVSMGSSKVTISIENYLDQSSTAKVKFPTFLIFLALFGGFLGGSLSLFMNKEKNYWKIIVSTITGPMLMWLALYMGIGNLSPSIILNPISCFLIAFIGGWAGVTVINLMLKGFGVATVPQVANDNNDGN